MGALLTHAQLREAAHLDTEGWSSLNLRNVGAYKWCEQPYAGCWCFVCALPHQAPIRWFPYDIWEPVDFLNHIAAGKPVIAHNVAFDRRFWNHVIRRYRPHWPEIQLEQCDCTMARVATLGIPGGIEFAAQVLKVENFEKESVGADLVKKYSTAGYDKKGKRKWPNCDEIQIIGSYCVQDVLIETALADKTIPLSARERAVWLLDQRINDRGFAIDLPLVNRLAAMVDVTRQRVMARLSELTDGFVTSHAQHARVAEWIRSRGIPCESTAKGNIPAIIETLRAVDWEGMQDVVQVLDLKRQGGKSSVDKLYKMLECVCNDGRLHGQLQYHGAITGRWAGRLTQPHNFYRVDPEKDGDDIDKVMTIVLSAEDAESACDEVEALFADFERNARALQKEGAIRKSPMDMAAKCLRATIIAPPGKKLVGGDKSNIEGRINAWIHGETWKVEEYKRQDLKLIRDTYVSSYAKSFGVEPGSVTGPQRQVGKVQELALGYQGSIGAYISMGANYNIKPENIADIVIPVKWDTADWHVAEGQYEFATKMKRETFGLSPRVWMALKVVVNAWRIAHPMITQGWWDLQDAAVNAVLKPGTPYYCCQNRVAYFVDRGVLWCILPSRRALAYCNPRIITARGQRLFDADGREIRFAKDSVDDDTSLEDSDLTEELGETERTQVAYDGFASQSKKWGFKVLYGGKQDENVVSGLARDALVEDMFRVEAAGYPLILTVHDELLAECDANFGSAIDFRWMMNQGYAWAPGLPLESKTWEGTRYEK